MCARFIEHAQCSREQKPRHHLSKNAPRGCASDSPLTLPVISFGDVLQHRSEQHRLHLIGNGMTIEHHEAVLRSLSKTKAVLFFLFRKAAFIRLSTEHDTAQGILGAEDLRQAYIEGKYKPNVEHTAELANERTSELRQAFRDAFLWVLGSTLLSIAAGLALQFSTGICSQWLSSVLQLVGVAIILWATIWELGWNVRSMDGNSLPERVHQWVFRLMYVVGSSLFFLAYAWGTNWRG
jgi:hypothetical protein